MYRCRLVRLRLSLLKKNARFQSNDAPQKPKPKPRIASDWGGIRITNEPLAQQLTAHRIQTERKSGVAPNPEPQSETAPNPPPGAPLLDLPPQLTLNAVGMNKPLSPKSRAFQKSLANLDQFFERKEPEPVQADKKKRKPVPVVSTGDVGPSGYVRRSAHRKEGAPQAKPTPRKRDVPPSVKRAAVRQTIVQREQQHVEEEEVEPKMTREEIYKSIDQRLASTPEEEFTALLHDAMEALDLTDQEKEALSDEDKREFVREWMVHNQGDEGETASLKEEEESLDAAAIDYMRFYRRRETLEPEYLEADVDFALPPYEPEDGLQDGLSPYRPLSLATPRPPRDFARGDYTPRLPIDPRALRKTVKALGYLRHAQAVLGHNQSIRALKGELSAEIEARQAEIEARKISLS
ncbi:hypothetical protein BDZ89DRAFT_1156409 [Hymenopellis radicata]|nr:hypothetical protein BDZ89DRAFT_1156409 [Hymenopellis radicata]